MKEFTTEEIRTINSYCYNGFIYDKYSRCLCRYFKINDSETIEVKSSYKRRVDFSLGTFNPRLIYVPKLTFNLWKKGQNSLFIGKSFVKLLTQYQFTQKDINTLIILTFNLNSNYINPIVKKELQRDICENTSVFKKIVVQLCSHDIVLDIENICPLPALKYIHKLSFSKEDLSGISKQIVEGNTKGEYQFCSSVYSPLLPQWDILSINGTWSIIPKHDLLHNLAMWHYNGCDENSPSLQLFEQHYGNAFGRHYYEKWQHYNRDILKMAGYFSTKKELESFMHILHICIEEYKSKNLKRISLQ